MRASNPHEPGRRRSRLNDTACSDEEFPSTRPVHWDDSLSRLEETGRLFRDSADLGVAALLLGNVSSTERAWLNLLAEECSAHGDGAMARHVESLSRISRFGLSPGRAESTHANIVGLLLRQGDDGTLRQPEGYVHARIKALRAGTATNVRLAIQAAWITPPKRLFGYSRVLGTSAGQAVRHMLTRALPLGLPTTTRVLVTGPGGDAAARSFLTTCVEETYAAFAGTRWQEAVKVHMR